jgi:steroid 5-alpha reductase family enzyme/uncharacterized membrane protein
MSSTDLFALIAVMGPSFAGAALFIAFGYGLSRIFKRNDIADALWGIGFVIVGAVHYFWIGASFRSNLIFAMVCVWGIRLSLHLSLRVWKHPKEDIRYAKWRKEWGAREPWMAFFKVFLLQGIFLAIVAMPIGLLARHQEVAVGALDFAGLSVFILGFIFEAVADMQLVVFKRDVKNANKVLKTGLWAICRHPNYFGEILVWWGVFLIASSDIYGWSAVISPLTITFLLIKVSGVPMTERTMTAKGADFIEYCRATPALFPLRARQMLQFFTIFSTLILGDAFWLGFVMKTFYIEQSKLIGRIVGGEWDIVTWSALAVYICLALGIQVFCYRPRWASAEAVLRGALFGLCTYGVYEFTNLAMVNHWPAEMAIVDLAWGTILCSSAALAASLIFNRGH